jgi:hypothetical protein
LVVCVFLTDSNTKFGGGSDSQSILVWLANVGHNVFGFDIYEFIIATISTKNEDITNIQCCKANEV